MSYYINFRFENLVYNESCYSGTFCSLDSDIHCDFSYDRNTGKYAVRKCNVPVSEALPLPVWWLDKTLREKGYLEPSEARICL